MFSFFFSPLVSTQNTSKNFVGCSFGSSQKLVVGGSEDGLVYVWDINTGAVVETLVGHTGVVYTAKWSEQASLLASCGDDNTIKTWGMDEAVLRRRYGGAGERDGSGEREE